MTIAQTLGTRLRSSVGRSLVGSLSASVGLQMLVAVSGILVARSLGPEDRGYLALLIVIAGVIALIGTLGLPTAMTYYIAQDPSGARRIASSLAWVGVLQVGVVLVVQTAALTAVVASEPSRVQVAAAISLLLPPGILGLQFGLAILQGQRHFAALNLLRISPSAAYVAGVVAIYALGVADLVPFMALWAGVNFVGGVLAVILAIRGLPRDAGGEPVPPLGQMLRFGLKALLGTLSPVDSVRLDQAVVGLFLTPVSLGLYVAAQAFTTLPRVVASSVGLVAYPQVAAESDRGAARRSMWRFFFLVLALSIPIVAVFELMAGELISLAFGEAFTEATTIAQILLVASLFVAARRVLTDGLNGLGYPAYGTIAEVTSWIVLVLGLAILLPWLEAEGVALALAIAWGASLLLLLALALLSDRTPAFSQTRLPGGIRRLAAFPRQFQTRDWLGGVAVLIVTVLAGLAVVVNQEVAIVLAVALTLGLFFAFVRKTFAEHARALRQRVARPEGSVPDDPDDDAFAVPRRLYYIGVLLLGFLVLRAGGQVTFSDLIFLASFGLASAEFVILRRRVPMTLPFVLLVGVGLFTLGGLLSTFESYEPLKSMAVIVRLVFLMVVWFWLGTVVLRKQAHITRAIGFWCASAALVGGGAILQFLAGDVIPGASIDGGRATGFAYQPNDLGAMTAIAFVPALMLASRAHASSVARAWSYLSLLLIAAGMVLSGSVGATLAAAVAVVLWLGLQRMSRHAMLALAILAASLVALTALGGPSPLNRLESVTTSKSLPGGGEQLGTAEQRIRTYRSAIARIQENPFVGVGLDLTSVTAPFGIESYEYDVHNLVIGLWYKTGLVGLAGMLLAIAVILRSGWMAILGSRSTSESKVAIALASSVVAFVVFAMTAPVLFTRLGWMPAALVLAFRSVQQEQEALRPTARSRRARRIAPALLQP